jgi:hypothetical protein
MTIQPLRLPGNFVSTFPGGFSGGSPASFSGELPSRLIREPTRFSSQPGDWQGELWVSRDPLTDPHTYRAQVAAFEKSGLWPVLIPHDPRFAASGADWTIPWRSSTSGRVGRSETGAGAAISSEAIAKEETAAEETLARWWDARCCTEGCLRPFESGFPGLALPGWVKNISRADPIAEAGNTGSVLVARGSHRLGLVRTARPADIPTRLNWTGMSKSTNEVGGLSAVLRSWEHRFGATLVVLGFDELEFSVAAPPRDYSRALRLAAEHRAFSLPTFTRQPDDLRGYARNLVYQRRWRFSWA